MGEIENMDFVVPLKQLGLFTRSVLEGISFFYNPRRIIVVIREDDIPILQKVSLHWKVKKLEIINENIFFMKNYGLTIENLQKVFQTTQDNKHREFGWWYQQMIKLGSSTQIDDISEHYIVWDGDLIPLQKWDLTNKNNEGSIDYYIAILQNQPRSEFNKDQYEKCIQNLLGFSSFSPTDNGTFVTHHMIFKVEYVKEMIHFILDRKKISIPWPLYFISLSHDYFRFSEYMLYASFMMKFHSFHFFYYPYESFGKTGLRFRKPDSMIQELCTVYPSTSDVCFSYQEIFDFFQDKQEPPSYVQFEHVYYLL
jgi:hypothetical protein